MMLAFALILCAAGQLGSIAGPVVPPTCRAAGQLPAGCPTPPAVNWEALPARGAADVPRCRSTPGRLPYAPGRQLGSIAGPWCRRRAALPVNSRPVVPRSRPVADVPALRPRAPGPRCCPPGRLSNRGRMRLETLTVEKVGLKGTSWRARAGGSSAACGRPAAVDGRRSGWRLAAGDPGSGPRPTNLLDARSNCCRGGRFKSV